MSELFPELDHILDEDPLVADDPRPSAPVVARALTQRGRIYTETEARIDQPGQAAGAESLARFEAALGLPGLLRSLKRTEGGEIEFVVELPGGRVAAGSIVAPGRPALRQGASFGVSYRGRELPALLGRALLRFLARYDGVPFEHIEAQVVPDPGDEHMLRTDYPASLFYAYAPASGWRRFFEGTELYRGVCGAHDGNVAIIEHTDIECLYNVAPHDNRLPSFFASPRIERSHGGDARRPQLAARLDARRLFTDIRDRDVIMGADRLLDQALVSLASDPSRPSTVFVHSGCLPEVTGDDLDASVARTRDVVRLPVVVVGNENDPVAAALGELVAERELEPRRTLEPGTVVLLGVPEIAGREELVTLLERAGVRVLASALPSFGPSELDACTRAAVLVAYPWERHRRTIAALCERLAPAVVIADETPFGLAGTRRWLRAVAVAAGRAVAMDAVIEERLAALAPDFRALRARARRYRVGFVVDHPDWQAALAPRRSVGVPMLALLREMGFGVDVLVYQRPGVPAPSPATQAVADARTPRIRRYRDRAELERLLAEPGVVAWYSELRYDRRLTRSGKNPFSLQQFRMGFGGACDALRELVELAELPFFRRYHAYLGPAFADDHGGPRR